MASDLKAVDGRVIVQVDMQAKNWHTFSHGQTIRHERGPNNLNYRETQPVQGEVLDSASIPEGSTILFQHNACHPYYQIFNYKLISGLDIASEIRYFSIPESACYLYRAPGDKNWLPLNGFTTGLRVFEPYGGLIVGIPHKRLENILYITSGPLKGQVVHTLRAADYEIVYQGAGGQEENVIRCRHWDNPEEDIHHREEIIMIDQGLTDQVGRGELLVGVTISDAKLMMRWNAHKIDISKFNDRAFAFYHACPTRNRLFDDEFTKWEEG